MFVLLFVETTVSLAIRNGENAVHVAFRTCYVIWRHRSLDAFIPFLFHPAGDVTRVSVMPRQWKSGMPRIGVGGAEIKINEKEQKFLFV